VSKSRPRARKPARRVPPESVEAYLATVPPAARSALEKLRQDIRSAAPGAEEVISYRVPTFRLRGGLVAFAGFEDHCSFFLMSTAVIPRHAGELRGYETRQGTIRFDARKPLPAALVRKLVKARIEENALRRA
jgi:uncharacterized protein YdhG (YjbR/CyaY superfamily)